MIHAYRPDVFVLQILDGPAPDANVGVRSGPDGVRVGVEERLNHGRLLRRPGTKRQGGNILGRRQQILSLP